MRLGRVFAYPAPERSPVTLYGGNERDQPKAWGAKRRTAGVGSFDRCFYLRHPSTDREPVSRRVTLFLRVSPISISLMNLNTNIQRETRKKSVTQTNSPALNHSPVSQQKPLLRQEKRDIPLEAQEKRD